MSLKIRLARGGAKKRPVYRIVVADARAPRDGRFIEKLGTYSPMQPKDSGTRVVLDIEKAKEWLAKGAQPSESAEKILVRAGVMEKKVPQPKAKLELKRAEQAKAAEARAKVRAEEAAKAEAAAAKAAEEATAAEAEAAPAEEAAAEE